jgi:O-antigen ligase
MLVALLVTMGMILVNSRVNRMVALIVALLGGILYFLPELWSLYEALTALKESTYQLRFRLQRLAWEQFVENNYLGVDYGALGTLARGHWLHNAYLVLLFGGGILGSLPVFGYILMAIGRGIQVYFSHSSKRQRVVAGALLAGLSVTLVEWLAYGQIFNYASWLVLTLLFLLPLIDLPTIGEEPLDGAA